ncbi:cbb3-type cytochrome c oxidase subunit I [Planctomycetota bacterium]|nr:cbb3-type cytochrome c oxidase subunit I [Planctomycetota bacterium]
MSSERRQDAAPAGPAGSTGLWLDDGPTRRFLAACWVWGLAALALATLAGWSLLHPELADDRPALGFGRLRPLVEMLLLHGFLANGFFALVHNSTQRLCCAPMAAGLLGRVHLWGWQLALAWATWTVGGGALEPRLLSPAEAPVDLALAGLWTLFGVQLLVTLTRRRQRYMYASLWFYLAATLLFGGLQVTATLASFHHPIFGVPLFSGAADAALQWWYVRNGAGALVVIGLFGVAYDLAPRIAAAPLYSYRMGIVHLWSLLLIQLWVAPRHLHLSPSPGWLSALALAFAFLVWLPSASGIFNLAATLRDGRQGQGEREPARAFLVAALFFFALAAIEEPVLALRRMSAAVGSTDWVEGHQEMLFLGWGAFVVFAGSYWIAPRILHAPLHSPALARAHFWLATLGVLTSAAALRFSGAAQAGVLGALSPDGHLLHPEFTEAVARVEGHRLLHVAGLGLFLAGALVGAWNLLRTWAARPSAYPSIPVTEPPLEPMAIAEEAPAPPAGAVLDGGRRLQVFCTLWWHRRLERRPLRLASWIVVAVGAVAALQLGPLLRAEPTAVASLTPLEAYGRSVYEREGCVTCHTQAVRPLLADTKRYGAISTSSDPVERGPALWGTRRVGPDLAREGGRRSTRWQVLHLDDPRAASPGSLMPSYRRLLERPRDLPRLVQRSGFTKRPEWAADAAAAQAAALTAEFEAQHGAPLLRPGAGAPAALEGSEAIALVAYLQQLGLPSSEIPFSTAASEQP